MKNKKLIFIQGLGVIGSINAFCISHKNYNDQVIGFESKNKNGEEIIRKINQGQFPFKSKDKKLKFVVNSVRRNRNLIVTNNYELIKQKKSPDIIICCLALKYFLNKKKQTIENNKFIKNFSQIIQTINHKTLIIVQTSLPPGFSKKFLIPLASKTLKKNTKGKFDVPLYSYSYERVTPGYRLVDSFLNEQRVFSYNNIKAKKLFKSFFSKILNFNNPLLELNDITECETGKILENSYRATNIAFLNEWMDYSKKLKLNLNKILEFIRLRPTHSNIRYPGLGVGGFCLTKDPMFGKYSLKEIFKFKNDKFKFSTNSIIINQKMINHTIEIINEKLVNLKKKRILLVGITYIDGSDDIRSSPSLELGRTLKKEFKSDVVYYDKFYGKKSQNLNNVNFKTDYFDAVIFCVKGSFSNNVFKSQLIKKTKLVLDTSQIFDKKITNQLMKLNKKFVILGNYKY